MKITWLGIAVLSCVCALLVLLGTHRVAARQVVRVPSAEELRFQLIGNEPIAGPDGRALVTGWSVLVFKDCKAGQCYVAFEHRNGITATPLVPCPQ